jgi:hypothetical protein
MNEVWLGTCNKILQISFYLTGNWYVLLVARKRNERYKHRKYEKKENGLRRVRKRWRQHRQEQETNNIKGRERGIAKCGTSKEMIIVF